MVSSLFQERWSRRGRESYAFFVSFHIIICFFSGVIMPAPPVDGNTLEPQTMASTDVQPLDVPCILDLKTKLEASKSAYESNQPKIVMSLEAYHTAQTIKQRIHATVHQLVNESNFSQAVLQHWKDDYDKDHSAAAALFSRAHAEYQKYQEFQKDIKKDNQRSHEVMVEYDRLKGNPVFASEARFVI